MLYLSRGAKKLFATSALNEDVDHSQHGSISHNSLFDSPYLFCSTLCSQIMFAKLFHNSFL